MVKVSDKIRGMMDKLQTGEIKGQSELLLRNEEAQQQIRLTRFGKFEKVLKKRSRLLIPLDIAIPFDPYTGKVTEQYNKNRKFRPLLSATSVTLMLKTIASESPEVKAAFERYANVEEWDVSNLDEVTEQDKLIMRLYRVPRIFTIPVCEVRDQRVTGYEFGQKYSVSVSRDPVTGALIGGMPLFLQANKLYREMVFEESAHIDECIKNAREGKPYTLETDIQMFRGFDLATIKEADVKEIKKKYLWSKIWISEDRPANYIVLYEMPMKNDLTLNEQSTYSTVIPGEMEATLKLVPLTKEMTLAIDNYKNGTFSGADGNYDFWELDMICPTTVKDESDKMELGKDTKFTAPQYPIRPVTSGTPAVGGAIEVFQYGDKVINAVRESLDDSGDWEERFLFSVRIRKMDEDIERKILDIIEDRGELNNRFLTEKVLKANADFISLVYGQAGDVALAKLDLGESGRVEGELDEKAAESESKVNLMDALMDEESETAAETEGATEEIKENKTDDLDMSAAELSL